MIRTTATFFFLVYWTLLSGQQMNWSRLAEDTIYYANEYQPDHIMPTPGGPGQIWDFRSLRAPYALSRRVLVTGERNGNHYGQIVIGKQPEAVLRLHGNTAEIVQIMDDNPICTQRRLTYNVIPAKKTFFHSILGGSYNYTGKMQAVFSWPRDIKCRWTPAELPDSCRITYFITEEIVVDAEGTLYLPTEVSTAYRQVVKEKRTIKIETKKGNTWKDVTQVVPDIHPIVYRDIQRFVSSNNGIPLVDIEMKDDINPVRVEFKTHPLVTRIFSEEPSRPDIFAYPNPSFGIVRFQLSDLLYGKYKLKIFNILGVSVKEQDIDVNHPRETITLDLGDLQRGTYLYRLQDAFGRTIKTKRVVLIQP